MCSNLNNTSYSYMGLKAHANAAGGGQGLVINTSDRLELQRCKYAASVTTSYITIMSAPLAFLHVINPIKWVNFNHVTC